MMKTFILFVVTITTMAGCNALATDAAKSQLASERSQGRVFCQNDSYKTNQDVALYVSAANGVLANDAPSDGIVSYSHKTNAGGSLRGYSEGSFFYSPPPAFVGTDTFAYSTFFNGQHAQGYVEILVEKAIASKLSIDLYGGSARFEMPKPNDSKEFESYLKAQVAGGALTGSTAVRQADAVPQTRFALVQDPIEFNAGLARNYACQIASQGMGYGFLDPAGMAEAAAEYEQLHPEAKLFLQVAAVFKGDLLGGPGEYDNEGLKDLLISKGLDRFINDPKVGVNDIQTLGAIGAAMNAGQLTMADILNSGTFEDIERYDEVVEFIYTGKFKALVTAYEVAPI